MARMRSLADCQITNMNIMMQSVSMRSKVILTKQKVVHAALERRNVRLNN